MTDQERIAALEKRVAELAERLPEPSLAWTLPAPFKFLDERIPA